MQIRKSKPQLPGQLNQLICIGTIGAHVHLHRAVVAAVAAAVAAVVAAAAAAVADVVAAAGGDVCVVGPVKWMCLVHF